MRSIVESIEVMAEVEDNRDRWARFDDAWDTLFWVLMRDPTVGQPLTEGGNVRAFVFDGSFVHEIPTIDLVYEITLTQIVLRRVRFRDAGSSGGQA